MTIDIEKLLAILPQVVMLLLPGWAFIWTYRFVSRRPYKRLSFSIEIVVLSYVFSLIIPPPLAFVDRLLGTSLKTSSVALLCVVLILGVTFGYFRGLPKTEKIIGNILGVRLEESIWEGITDIERGCYVQVFLDGEKITYRGAFRRFFTDGNDTWIELQSYTAWSLSAESRTAENKDGLLYSYKDHPENMVAIKSKNINRIEILYSKSSNKI